MGAHTYIFWFILVVVILHDACDSTSLDDLVLNFNLKETSKGSSTLNKREPGYMAFRQKYVEKGGLNTDRQKYLEKGGLNTRVFGQSSPAFVKAAECLFKGDGTGGVVGKVTIEQKELADGDETHFLGEINGLSPGLHGFHVHAKGDLGDDCKAAGGHFNPFDVNHGGKDAPLSMRHVGDLGNVEAGYGGTVKIDFWDKHALLHAGNNGILGKAIVIHEGEDDLGLGGDDGSIATGNAGARAGCCIIEPTKDWKLK